MGKNQNIFHDVASDNILWATDLDFQLWWPIFIT